MVKKGGEQRKEERVRPSGVSERAHSRQPRDTLRWHAIERGPAKRWWWWLVFGYLAMFVLLVSTGFGDWSLAILVAAAVTCVVVVSAVPSRERRYTLRGQTLTINGTSFDLTRFTGAMLEEPGVMPGASSAALLLLPARRFGAPLTIFLPDDERRADKVVASIYTVVPPTGRAGYRSSLRFVDTIARWLRLG